jgi:hypothetical protein
MLKVTFDPIKELIVHEVLKVDYDDLLRERITPAGSAPLCWCNGYLFSFASLPFSKAVISDYLEGKVHWAEVHYTEMKSYTPILELNDEHYTGTQKIRAIDTSRSGLHTEFTKWLKKNR